MSKVKCIECSFVGCNNKHYAKTLCKTHYDQQYRGKALTKIKYRRKSNTPPIVEYEKVFCENKNLIGDCHIFCGPKNSNGYGLVYTNGNVLVHRYVWEQKFGIIPKGLVMDHQCRNRACCNVNHLRLVTQKVNVTENIQGANWQLNKAKTHCKRGHEFTPENTIPRCGGRTRECRQCKKLHDKKR